MRCLNCSKYMRPSLNLNCVLPVCSCSQDMFLPKFGERYVRVVLAEDVTAEDLHSTAAGVPSKVCLSSRSDCLHNTSCFKCCIIRAATSVSYAWPLCILAPCRRRVRSARPQKWNPSSRWVGSPLVMGLHWRVELHACPSWDLLRRS